jgi:magnesium-transporting ATPase (P-type)
MRTDRAVSGEETADIDPRATDARAGISGSVKAEEDAVPWYALEVEAVLARLNTSDSGLTGDEPAARLDQFGPNRLQPPKPKSALVRFAQQFNNVLIYVLLGAAVVTGLLQHWLDTSVIIGVVIINAAIGFLQEGKAERALDAIRSMLSMQALALRDGKRLLLPAEELVPGDIVYLRSGDKVPADIRLVQAKTLQIQEAALTGESLPVTKEVAAISADAALGDRRSMAYSSTLVTYGQGCGVVVHTGDKTEIGRISAMLADVQLLVTPLLKQMATFGQWLTGAIVVVATITFVFGIFVHGYSAEDMFLASVGLAVAAIPEGLPAIMTITLAIGVQHMAHRRAIVRRLPAVETLGSVSVICSDKTGTLTKNEMTVQTLVTAQNLLEVDGVGYAPYGNISRGNVQVTVSNDSLLREIALAAALCSEAGLHESDEGWVVDGSPTEGALLAVAMKAGLDPAFEARALPRTDLIPFESEHRCMGTLHHDHAGRGFIFVKGAPERILGMCDRQRTSAGDEALDGTYWHQRMEDIAARGQRVLALASNTTSSDHTELSFHDIEGGMRLLGMFGLADPPRQEAIDAVASCQAAGIRVKMITGDHATTAGAIGRVIGLSTEGGILTGRELDALSEAELRERALQVDIFARTSPEHKLHLVQALQATNHVVAMTGDGVNDAPALKRADVGVAMGKKGTEAAKEAAEMVLADDNFASIADAVEEGRAVYDNIKKAIIFILPTNGGEALTIMAAIALGHMLPITPVQILWVNMVTAVTLALALAFEPAERHVMQRSPRAPQEPLLSGFLLWRIVFVSAILVVGTFGLYLWARNLGADVALARTVAVNTLVMFEVFYLFNSRFLRQSVFNLAGLLGSRPALLASVIVISLQIAFTYAPPLQYLFDSRSLDLQTWLLIVAVASSVLWLVELEKWFLARREKARAAPLSELGS